MRVGLIDVDGHNFPNIALMKLSAWHKAQGDTVEWWYTDLVHYDIVYMSKVFSDSYSQDVPEPLNADKVVKGGTGYAISLVGGLEVYDKSKDPPLPPEVEAMCPDYSIYPDLFPDTAIGFLTRGCPRGCKFCHVAAKEGRKSIQVAEAADFYRGQGNIEIMDPNILANKNRDKLLEDLIATKAKVNFNQGLDIRLTSDGVAEQLGRMRIKRLHFAWDNHKEDLTRYFEKFGGGVPQEGRRREDGIRPDELREHTERGLVAHLHFAGFRLRPLRHDIRQAKRTEGSQETAAMVQQQIYFQIMQEV